MLTSTEAVISRIEVSRTMVEDTEMCDSRGGEMCDDQECEMEDTNSSLSTELRSKRDRKIMAYGHFTLGVKAVKSYEVFKKLGIDMKNRTLRSWFHDFKQGRIKFSDEAKPGRKPATGREDNVQRIKELIEADPYISYKLIREQTNVATGSITRILQKDLKLEKYNNLWIPVGLSIPDVMARLYNCP